ncbi:MAG: 3-oxoacyl-ACP synthase, partial [Bacteroidales bacterium]|nr:3-oxoacyl-ACP synthase [Bacteroidales bacterium]
MKIIGTGSALPKKVVTNDMLTEFFDTSDEWIRTRTGISTRRILTDESLIDLAIEASQKAL